MAVLESHIERESAAYRESRAHFEGLVAELRERTAQARAGGGPEAIAKHRKRNKLLSRERVEVLCDPETPFLEFNPLAAWAMYNGEAPSAGIVTGIVAQVTITGGAEARQHLAVCFDILFHGILERRN